jgi:hypothetical protein
MNSLAHGAFDALTILTQSRFDPAGHPTDHVLAGSPSERPQARADAVHIYGGVLRPGGSGAF